MSGTRQEDGDRPRRLDLRVWYRILAHARPYRRQGLGLALVAVLIAACEVLLPYLVGRIVDDVTGETAGHDFRFLASSYVIVVLLLCAGILGYILLAGRIASAVSHDIRRASFAKLQQLSFSFFDHRPVGWLMARLTSDCDRLSRIIGWTLLDFLWGFCMVFGISGMMFYLNWSLALIVMTVVPPLAWISIYFQRRLLLSAREVRRTNAVITANFNESIMGVRTSKALVREAENLREFQRASEQMFEHSVHNALQSAVYVPLVISLGTLMSGVALWFGGARVLGGTMTIGTLVSFMNYAALFFDPIQQLARQLTEVQMAQAAAERIQKLLETEPEIKDSPQVVAAIAAAREEAAAGRACMDGGDDRLDSVQFRDVSFAYQTGRTVLHDINLNVHAGERIALVGPTGGGKSTLVNLLCRFYEPTHGEILIGDVDYRQRSLHWLQANLAVVLQTPHLFSGTIRDNIRYGNLAATDEQIVAAAKTVNADAFIARMEDGYANQVGEGGSRLSTGQKQLLSLARAVLADPRIFVMDEATSSVDTGTERLIQEGIERIMEGRISFVIAHRLSTIRSASRILVVEDGRIVEMGRHEDLLERRGRYFDLHSHQFARELLTTD